jgi:opacity protein-like surface antigen
MKSIRNALLAAAVLAALPAMAQYRSMSYSPFYFGVGAGQGNLNRDAGDLTGLNNGILDDSATTYTIRGGWRMSPYMALEVGYYDLGKYTFSGTVPASTVRIDGEVKAKAYAISFVGILPLDRFDLYGRIGYANSELKANVHATTTLARLDEKDHQGGATYGVGGRWEFVPHWALFAEWMKNDKIKVDSYLLGIDFKF